MGPGAAASSASRSASAFPNLRGTVLLPGDALQSAWRGSQDAGLLSYLMSAVAAEATY